jgi:hypothetical protein
VKKLVQHYKIDAGDLPSDNQQGRDIHPQLSELQQLKIYIYIYASE